MKLKNTHEFEELYFVATGESFSASAIESHLKTLPFTFKHTDQGKNKDNVTYLVCSNEASKKICNESIKVDSNIPYGVCIPVNFNTAQVGIGLVVSDDKLQAIYNFIEWLITHHQCNVIDDWGRDWTDSVAEKGINALFDLTT